MQYFGFDRPSFGIKTFGFGSSEFSPLDLFAGGKQGVWYDPSDKSTLFQDVAGTIPVTKDGDPVGLMLDKSGNDIHISQAVSSSRVLYKTDGVLHWLQFDGVDDFLSTSASFPFDTNAFYLGMGIAFENTTARYPSGFCFTVTGSDINVVTSVRLAAYSESGDYLSLVGFSKDGSGEVYYYNLNSRPPEGVNMVMRASRKSSTASDFQVLPTHPTPVAATDVAIPSGSSKLFLGTGVLNSYLKGRHYGFVWVEDSLSDITAKEVNDYMAKKTGVVS